MSNIKPQYDKDKGEYNKFIISSTKVFFTNYVYDPINLTNNNPDEDVISVWKINNELIKAMKEDPSNLYTIIKLILKYKELIYNLSKNIPGDIESDKIPEGLKFEDLDKQTVNEIFNNLLKILETTIKEITNTIKEITNTKKSIQKGGDSVENLKGTFTDVVKVVSDKSNQTATKAQNTEIYQKTQQQLEELMENPAIKNNATIQAALQDKNLTLIMISSIILWSALIFSCFPSCAFNPKVWAYSFKIYTSLVKDKKEFDKIKDIEQAKIDEIIGLEVEDISKKEPIESIADVTKEDKQTLTMECIPQATEGDIQKLECKVLKDNKPQQQIPPESPSEKIPQKNMPSQIAPSAGGGSNYYHKYIKYKTKYNELKNL
jgi:hypothetical protein